ncbi:MAG: GNAT family N-acetyltransferase [Lachnospiraceae bacterium]
MLKGVIFDMDGVITDTEPVHALAARKTLEQAGVTVPLSYCYDFIGVPAIKLYEDAVLRYSVNRTPEQLLEDNKPILAQLFAKAGHPQVPYAVPLIKRLKEAGLLLAIASSSPLPVIRQVLEEFGITDCFAALVSGAALPHPKPAPDIFLLAAKELGLLPKECIVIEDSAAGTMAAKAAGIPCVGFVNPNSGKQDLSRAYALLESFASADASYFRRTHAHALNEPAEIVTTDRLLIREFSQEDFPALFAMCKKPENTVWMEETFADYDTEKEKHKAYLSFVYPFFDLALWGIYEKGTNRLIGRAGFSPADEGTDGYALGYLIDLPYRNKGYAGECVPALLSYAKELGTDSVIAKIKKSNTASLRVLAACGYPYRTEAEAETSVTYRIFL